MTIGKVSSTRTVFFANKGDTIATAAKLMREHHAGCLVVIDKLGDRIVPAGMITDRDVTVGVVALGLDPAAITVGDVMSPDVVCARDDMSSAEVAALMRQHGLRRLPMINAAGELVDLITADDLIQLLAEEMSDLARMMFSEENREKQLRRTPTS